MALNRRKLREWIGRRALTPPLAVRFELLHVAQHGTNMVCQLNVQGSTADWAELIERQVSEESSDHVAGWPGRQQYIVRAYSEAEDTVGELPFALTARDGMGSEATADLMQTPPDVEEFMRGQLPDNFSHPHALVTQQQMRHNEILTRLMCEMAMHSRERDVGIIKSQQEQIDKMQRSRDEAVELREEMMDRSAERDMRIGKYTDDKARKDKLLSHVTKIILPEMARQAGLPMTDDILIELKRFFMALPQAVQESILEQPDSNRFLDLVFGKKAGEGDDKKKKKTEASN